MKKLEQLSEEQKEHLIVNRDRFIKKFLNSEKINKKIAEEVVAFVYKTAELDPPNVLYSQSPMAAQQLANKLCGTTSKAYNFGSFLNIGWAGFYSFYETFVDFKILDEENSPKYFQLRKFIDSNIYSCIFLKQNCILIQKPEFIHKNENGMHCASGPSIKWEDGFCLYFINGRRMPASIFTQEITKEMFLNEQNEDVKAGMYEIVESKGEGTMLSLLGAEVIDNKTIKHLNGEAEELTLFRTKEKFEMEEDLNGISPAPLAWLKMVCPSTGSTYLIPTDGSFNDCLEAAKYHRPNLVPKEVDYAWIQRN